MEVDRKRKGSPASRKSTNADKGSRSPFGSNGNHAAKKRGQISPVQFANVIENINEGFLALDAQMNYTYINQRGAELLKRKPEDLIGKNYWDEYPRDKDTSFFGQAYLRALETGSPATLEGYYAPSDRWFENRIYPSDGGLLIFFTDVSERIQVKEKLRESEEKYRALFDSIDEGFCIIEKVESKTGGPLDFRYLIANPAFGAQAGIGDVVGKTIRQAFPGEPEEWFETYATILRTGEAIRFERGLVTQGRVLELYAFRVEDKTHRRVAVIFKDITARKRAEQELAEFARQQESLYKLTDQLQRTNSLEDVFNAALDAILGALQCDRASILLFDDAGVMHFVAWRGLSDGYRKATDGHSPWTPDEKNAEPIGINDIDTAELNDSLKDIIKGEGIGSLSFIPLVSNGKLIGKFMIYYNAPRVFSKGEFDLSLTIARQLAFGIEHKRAEKSLRESEERFTRFMQHLPGLAWIKDVQGHYVYANAAAEKAFNAPHGELYGKTDQDVFPAEIAAQFKKNDERVLTNGVGVQVIETLEQDGVLHYSLVSKFPIPGPDGNIALIGGTAVDITERKQAEELLRESELRFREMIDALPAAIYTTDAEGLLTHFNPAAVEFSGRIPELGTDHWCVTWKLYHPDGTPLPHDQCPMAITLREGRAVRGAQAIAERPDGTRIWFEPYPTPLRDRQGRIVGGINMLVDITERKQAEDALRESEERFRAILGQATAGIVRKDTEGKLMFVNEAFCNMLGYTESELLGKTIWQLTHNDDVKENKRLYDRTMMEGIPFKLEKRLIRADGSILWVDVSVSPIMGATSKPQSAVAVEVDITGRKQAEEALRDLNIQLESRVQNRTVKLQEANQSLLNEIAERQKAEDALHESGKRLQILSQRLVEVQEEERRAIARELHDSVGQSLSALNINLVILDNQISNSANEQIRTRLNDSMQLTAETISLVRDVMSDLRPSVLDDYGLEAALQSSMDQFKSRYEMKILFDKPDQPLPRLGSSIEMTFLRIAQQALLNIVRHAHADQVNLSLEQNGNAVRLIVQDNGSGIESWQEANRPGSHGLTIMRERADAVGGNLRVLSVPGKGTRVEVSIPIENGDLPAVQKGKRE